MATIDVRIGDITTVRVDAIVNAANERLQAGGGVCGAIFHAAGEDQLQEACDAIGGCATGDAVATDAFALRERGILRIIHAVGPRWDGDEDRCDHLLASAYRRALEIADEEGLTSIALPALSTGIFGFPSDRAARIATRTVRAYDGPMRTIVLIAFDAATATLLERALADAP